MADPTVANVVRRIIDGAWNSGDVQTIHELVSEAYVRTGTSTHSDRDDFTRAVEDARRAIPDLHISIEDIVTDAGRGSLRLVVSGTHTAELFGMPPTGRQFAVDSLVFVHVRDGRLDRAWECTDLVGWRRQLGIDGSRE